MITGAWAATVGSVTTIGTPSPGPGPGVTYTEAEITVNGSGNFTVTTPILKGEIVGVVLKNIDEASLSYNVSLKGSLGEQLTLPTLQVPAGVNAVRRYDVADPSTPEAEIRHPVNEQCTLQQVTTAAGWANNKFRARIYVRD